MKTPTITEAELQLQVCDYLRYQYPDVIFLSDLSGVKMPIGLAKKVSRLKSGRGIPDLIILAVRGVYAGILIELKREGEKILKKNGSPVSDHIKEQLDMLRALSDSGYFAIMDNQGFESVKKIIDQYMKLKQGEIFIF